MGTEVRAITLHDFDETNRLLTQLSREFRESYDSIYFADNFNYSYESFEAMLSEDDTILLIASNEDDIFETRGICIAKYEPLGIDEVGLGSMVYIEALVVDARFRRQGVASLLYHEALDAGITMGAEYIYITMPSSNTAALDFYLAQGMEVIKHRTDGISELADTDFLK